MSNSKMYGDVKEITTKYGVYVLNAVMNIQATWDIELSHNIYHKKLEKMEDEIRALGNINDINYRDTA